jgi:hypothetical protein
VYGATVRHLPNRIEAGYPDALPSLPAGVWITGSSELPLVAR